MLKVIADYDDPSSTINFDNYIDIFNPIKSNWQPNATFKQFINALKVLWSRDNIIAHPEYYFQFDASSLHGPYPELIKKLIKPIPDEHLYLFHWFNIAGIDADNKLYYTQNKLFDFYISSGNQLIFSVNPGPRQRCAYSYRGDNYAVEITSLLSGFETLYITPNLDRHANARVYRDAGSPCYINSRLSQVYQFYFLNASYCRSVDGIFYQTEMIKHMMASSPEAILAETDPGSFDFTLKIPITKTNKAPLYRMLQYSASPTSLLPWPLVCKGEHNPILYGVELELATNYDVQPIIDATDEPFFIVKHDSSVTGDRRHKYELASVPMSFKMHKKQWAYWFSNLDYAEFDTSKDTNNGMHVHISKKAFADPGHIKNFVWFWTQPAHIEFMKFFSQRDNRSFHDYATIPPPHQGRSRVRTFQQQQSRCSEYRGCVHFSPKGTIEIRLFRGIVSLAEIIKNLEFVDSIFHYTMTGQNFTKMSLREYLKWLHEQPKNKYAIIKKYLSHTPKLQDTIEAADLLDLIFTEKEPSKIMTILEKSKRPITNTQVTILNQRWKKRIFILKDGKLILNPENKGSLSSLDRLLEQRILGKIKRAA